MHRRLCGQVLIDGTARRKRRVAAAVAVVFASVLLNGVAGASPDRSQAFQVTGSIEVRASLSDGSRSLTFSGSATFDVALTTDPDHFVTVPLTYDWTGTDGSCTWGGSGSDGELRLRLVAIRAGRPLVEFSGSTAYPEGVCNNRHESGANFYFYSGDHDGQSPIAPRVYWSNINGLGTGTLSVRCTNCGTPPGARYSVKAMWGFRITYSPEEPRAGQRMRVTENVVLLEKSSRDTAWTVVRSPNVKVRCDIYYTRSRSSIRKTTVRGRWRPGDRENDSIAVCGPWRIPTGARGSKLGITPRVTYRAKTLTPVRGRAFIRPEGAIR